MVEIRQSPGCSHKFFVAHSSVDTVAVLANVLTIALRFEHRRYLLGSYRFSRRTIQLHTMGKRKAKSAEEGSADELDSAKKSSIPRKKQAAATEPYLSEDGWTIHPPALLHK